MIVEVFTEQHHWVLGPGEEVPEIGQEVDELGKVVRINFIRRDATRLQEDW